jgi:uncharacterized protein (DUF983 family)
MTGDLTREPATGTMFRRALLLKCPRCGGRKNFRRRWLGKYPRCRSCGINWHRESGFELGPIALNVVVTFFLLGASMGIAFVATAPNFPVVTLMVVFVLAAVTIPLVAYPWMVGLWLAFDLAVHRPEAAEVAEAITAVAAGVTYEKRPSRTNDRPNA